MRYLILLGSFTLMTSLSAQEGTMQVLAKKIDGQIVLRWAPSSPALWLLGNANGYHIDRQIISNQAYDPNMFERLTPTPIKPWSRDQFRERLLGVNGFVLGAAATLYPDPTAKSDYAHVLHQMVEADRVQASHYATALRCADLSVDASLALGLRYQDEVSRSANRIVYRISLAGHSEFSAIIFVDPKAEVFAPVPVIADVQELEQSVILKWDREAHAPHFSGYFVERKSAKGDWVQLQDKPLLPGYDPQVNKTAYIEYKDSVANYLPHHYRIIGIDPFGMESEPSAEVLASGKDRTPPRAPHLSSVIPLDQQSVLVNWQYRDSEPSEDLDQLILKKGRSLEGPFTTISTMGSHERFCIDSTASAHQANVYVVEAVDTAGNRSRSNMLDAVIHDTIPPDAPANLIASVDSLGKVRLLWDQNVESDLYGYMVYFSHDTTEEFISLHGYPLKTNHYEDQLNLNSRRKHQYYAVRAVDNLRHHSDFSDWVAVERPDTIRPRGPSAVLVQVVGTDRVHVSWKGGEDNLREWIIDHHWNGMRTQTDTVNARQRSIEVVGLLWGVQYHFQVSSIDQAGLSSHAVKSNSIRLENMTDLELVAKHNIDNAEVELSWDFSRQNRYVIFRKENDGSWKRLSMKMTRGSYFDQELVRESTYRYRLMAVDPTGKKTFSNHTEVKISE
ncbi:MAG: hypothetical protein KTR24_08580 [Saprospiraceae bacterium]|nr:hypothetical protein [Saprospiraceae bacterium]